MITFNVPKDTILTTSKCGNELSTGIKVFVVTWFNTVHDEAGVYVSLERAMKYITNWVNHEEQHVIELLKLEGDLYHVIVDGKPNYWIVESELRF